MWTLKRKKRKERKEGKKGVKERREEGMKEGKEKKRSPVMIPDCNSNCKFFYGIYRNKCVVEKRIMF